MNTETHKIDREAVKTLAIAIGVRAAARQLGLSEERVMKWSQRDKWFKQPEPVPLPITLANHEVRVVRKPSDVLANVLAEDNRETKIGLSKAGRKAAETFAGMNGEQVIEQADGFSKIVTGVSKIHAWEAVQPGSGTLNLNLLSGQTVVQIGQQAQP